MTPSQTGCWKDAQQGCTGFAGSGHVPRPAGLRTLRERVMWILLTHFVLCNLSSLIGKDCLFSSVGKMLNWGFKSRHESTAFQP